jgi:RND family efflux transporter MFP subunit
MQTAVRTLILRVGIPLVIIVVMMMWLSGVFRREVIRPGKVKAAEAPVGNVPLLTVTGSLVPEIREAVGTVQPQFKTTISARLIATIVELPLSAGQRVRKGDLLVRLDDRDLRAKLEQARELLRRAEATHELAQSDYERDKPLFEKAVIPKSEFDQTNLRLKTSAADVAALQKALHDAEVTLGYTVIRSPYDALVIDKLSDVGDLAAPGKPLLTLYEIGRLWLEAAVPEEIAAALHLGERYRVRVDALGQEFSCRLVEMVPAADPASRTVTARLLLPGLDDLYPGMFGRVAVPTGKRVQVLIPVDAVLHVGQLTMVDVAQAGVLRRRAVQVGRRLGNQIEILSGLAPGETIALAPRKELGQ